LVLSNASFFAIFLRWRGATSWLETLYGLPSGLGFGVSLSAAFIGLTSGVDSSDVAVSISGFYLSLNLGSLFGVSVASLLIHAFVRSSLLQSLGDMPNSEQVNPRTYYHTTLDEKDVVLVFSVNNILDYS
jgi:hypothetical protein